MVCSVANIGRTEPTPCNGEKSEANDAYTERTMTHSWIGNKSIIGGCNRR
jgi:hypothetical protein